MTRSSLNYYKNIHFNNLKGIPFVISELLAKCKTNVVPHDRIETLTDVSTQIFIEGELLIIGDGLFEIRTLGEINGELGIIDGEFVRIGTGIDGDSNAIGEGDISGVGITVNGDVTLI